MSHRVILEATGAELRIGRSRMRALSGPHKGQWFTLSGITSRRGAHTVHASRRTRVGMQRVSVAPDVFGLIIEEIVNLYRHLVNALIHVRRKVDDGLILGALALVPLALFEAFHGAELTRHAIEMAFNAHMNRGEGH